MEEKKRCVIGMDCGTTNIKAVAVSEDGEIIAKASKESRMSSGEGEYREQDAKQWWKDAAEVLRQISEKVKEHNGKMEGIAISSHTVSLLALDEEGEPVRPAILYQDGRSVKEVQYVTDQVGYDRFVQIVGGQPAPAFLPGKLLWFKKHEKELFEKTRWVLQASSYIVFKMTGVLSSDLDQATRTQCMDMETMEWSGEIGQVIGVDLKRMLPPPVPVDHIVGHVTAEASKSTGIEEGTPVLSGCSDALAAMYATGMSRMGEAGESSGTSSLVFVGSKEQSPPTVPVVTRPCGLKEMPWIFDAPITTTGAVLKWFIDTFGDREKEEAAKSGKDIFTYLNELALSAPCGCRGLFFYPYLLGERAPLWNDHAKGMFIGLRTDTTRAELVRSLFEGTAFALRHVIETIKESGGRAESLRICGGGAKSDTWNQIKADMLQIPVYALDDLSGDVPVGDAILAGQRMGLFKDAESAVKTLVKIRKTYIPNEKASGVYDKLYPLYVQMYGDLDKDLQKLKAVIEQI